MQIVRMIHQILLPDGTQLRPGDRVIELHIWNEQFPCFAAGGATLGWGQQISRRVETSLRELARYLAAAPDPSDVRAIRAGTRIAGTTTTQQLLRICRRYGLEPGPDPGPPSLLESCRRFGENVFIALLVLARNAPAFRLNGMWRDECRCFCREPTSIAATEPLANPNRSGIRLAKIPFQCPNRSDLPPRLRPVVAVQSILARAPPREIPKIRNMH
jgi:hypothetical protein